MGPTPYDEMIYYLNSITNFKESKIDLLFLASHGAAPNAAPNDEVVQPVWGHVDLAAGQDSYPLSISQAAELGSYLSDNGRLWFGSCSVAHHDYYPCAVANAINQGGITGRTVKACTRCVVYNDWDTWFRDFWAEIQFDPFAPPAWKTYTKGCDGGEPSDPPNSGTVKPPKP